MWLKNNLNIFCLNRLARRTGMTIVEASLTIMFFSVVIGVSFLLAKTGWDSWQINNARIQVTQQLRQSMLHLYNDLRQAGLTTITGVDADSNWYHAVTFAKADSIAAGNVVFGSTINYALGGSDGDQIIRTQDSTSQPVAIKVSEFKLRRLASVPNIMEVEVKAEVPTVRMRETIQATIFFKVYLRN